MKTTIFLLTFFSFTAIADVCSLIEQNRSGQGKKCERILDEGPLPPAILSYAESLASSRQGGSALKLLQMSQGKAIDVEVARLCFYSFVTPPRDALSCYEASLDRSFSPAVLPFLRNIASKGIPALKSAIKISRDAEFDGKAVEVCESMTYRSTTALNCLKAIKNKSYYDDSHLPCAATARHVYGGPDLGVRCLESAGMDFAQ